MHDAVWWAQFWEAFTISFVITVAIGAMVWAACLLSEKEGT